MKKTLLMALALAFAAVVSGCNQNQSTPNSTTETGSTNAPVVTSTNK